MRRIFKPTILFVVVGFFLCVLSYYRVNPATSYLMPKCLFKMLTGYDCPSCGVQRVVHMVLHGNIKEAFLLNPFLFIVAPYLLTVFYAKFSKDKFAIEIRPFVYHYITICVYIFLYFLWWFVRNTEFWHNLLNLN